MMMMFLVSPEDRDGMFVRNVHISTNDSTGSSNPELPVESLVQNRQIRKGP
jgi:hypothetical protein